MFPIFLKTSLLLICLVPAILLKNHISFASRPILICGDKRLGYYIEIQYFFYVSNNILESFLSLITLLSFEKAYFTISFCP